MKRALIPLLLIIGMVLTVSIATARDFSPTTGTISNDNGWSVSGNWLGSLDQGVGTYTDSVATASHPVVTGASGVFRYDVQFRIYNAANKVKIGLATTSGTEYAIEYRNGYLYFGGTPLGALDFALTDDPHTVISSNDGNVWHYDIGGYNGDVNVGAVPASATLALTDSTGGASSPMIFSVSFVSAGDPAAVTPTPTPAPAPAPASGAGPSYDPQQVQNFYDNVYSNIFSPYDTVVPDGHGGYIVTKGTPGSTPAAAAGFTVSGLVTGSADSKSIAGASVLLGNAIKKTGDDGKYAFDGIGSGTYDIAVSADGFASQTQSVSVSGNLVLNFALDKAAAGGSTVASAANESANVTTVTNTTMTNTTMTNTTMTNTTVSPTAVPSATQTKSPGFEGIAAAIAMIGVAGALVYLNRKR